MTNIFYCCIFAVLTKQFIIIKLSVMTNIVEVENKMITLREQQVILDSDVAELYGVETKRINEAVSNNPEKFPKGYVLQIDNQEFMKLRSKFSTTKMQMTRQLPKAFTEKGLYNNLNAIRAHASASASAWWWFVIGQPQASATVCNWWLGNRRPKWRREARQVQWNS